MRQEFSDGTFGPNAHYQYVRPRDHVFVLPRYLHPANPETEPLVEEVHHPNPTGKYIITYPKITYPKDRLPVDPILHPVHPLWPASGNAGLLVPQLPAGHGFPAEPLHDRYVLGLLQKVVPA